MRVRSEEQSSKRTEYPTYTNRNPRKEEEAIIVGNPETIDRDYDADTNGGDDLPCLRADSLLPQTHVWRPSWLRPVEAE